MGSFLYSRWRGKTAVLSVQLGVGGGDWVSFCTADGEEGDVVISVISVHLGLEGQAGFLSVQPMERRGMLLFL